MSRIRVERSQTPHSFEVWQFDYDERAHQLRIVDYQRWARETSRHKHKQVAHWDRCQRRDSAPLVPPPEDVLTEAKQKFVDTLTVTGTL